MNIKNDENEVILKMCPKCHEMKKLEVVGYCKECNKEYQKKYHKNYREEQRGYYLYIVTSKDNEVLYVGATEILKERLNQHVNKHTDIKDIFITESWECIKYLNITNLVDSREEMLMLENNLIDLYETKYNKNKSIIRNVTNLRQFELLATVHSLTQEWKTYCVKQQKKLL